MFADLKDVPTFGNNSASAWAYTEKDPFDCSRTSNPPAPNDADVKALLRMLSCNVDEDATNTATVSALYDHLDSGDDRDDEASPSHSLMNGSSDFLQLYRHREMDGSATGPLLASASGMKEGAVAGHSWRQPDSSSSNAPTGSSSTSSNTERTVSTTTTAASRSADSTMRFASHPPRHNTAVSNALANIGSGLAEENFNVLTPDKRMMLSIPAEYIQTTLGSRNYRHRNRDKLLFSFCLCKTFCSGATCHHGSDCDFIHCDPEKLRLVQSAAESKGKKSDPTSVHSFQVHWSTPVRSLDEATYPRLPGGYVVYVKGGEGVSGNAPQALPSELVYATVGGQEALRLPSSAPLRVCKHYEREKCARGALCHFIHPVALVKPTTATAQLPPMVREGQAMSHSTSTSAAGSAFGSMTELSHTSSYPAQRQQSCTTPAQPAAAAHPPNAVSLLTAAQLPSGALVRYGDALFMWVPERQQLVPLHTTNAPNPAGQPSTAMRVNVDYQRGVNGAMGSPAGFQMPSNAMLVQSSSAIAAYPAQNPYGAPQMPPSQSNPVYPSMLFPC